MIVQIDSRENKNYKIKDYFDKVGQEYFISKLPCGDYANPQNMKVVVELKHSHNDGLSELVNNLCRADKHECFKNEVLLAKKIGVERFVVLVASKDIDSVDKIHMWKNKYGKVYPSTFEKVVKTFIAKYDIEFQFCKPNECGKKILEILNGQ